MALSIARLFPGSEPSPGATVRAMAATVRYRAVAHRNLRACLTTVGTLSLDHARDLDDHHRTVLRLDAIERLAEAGRWPEVDQALGELRPFCERLVYRPAARRALSLVYGAMGFAADCQGPDAALRA